MLKLIVGGKVTGACSIAFVFSCIHFIFKNKCILLESDMS